MTRIAWIEEAEIECGDTDCIKDKVWCNNLVNKSGVWFCDLFPGGPALQPRQSPRRCPACLTAEKRATYRRMLAEKGKV